MPGRYGQPPGFGGGYTQPTRGEFQPGTEVGVIDPNTGRFYTCVSGTAMGAHASATRPSMARHSTGSTPTMAAHCEVTRPQMNAGCSA